MAGIPLSTLQRMSMEGDRQATSILDRFEARYAALRRESHEITSSMQHEGSNEGRGAGTVTGTVNGTETRVQRRWQSTPINRVSVPVRDTQGRIVRFKRMDRTVYVIGADGSRTAWIDPRAVKTAPKRKSASRKSATAVLEQHERMGIRPDLALADGTA